MFVSSNIEEQQNTSRLLVYVGDPLSVKKKLENSFGLTFLQLINFNNDKDFSVYFCENAPLAITLASEDIGFSKGNDGIAVKLETFLKNCGWGFIEGKNVPQINNTSLSMVVYSLCSDEFVRKIKHYGVKGVLEKHGNGQEHFSYKCGNSVWEIYPQKKDSSIDISIITERETGFLKHRITEVLLV